MRKAFGIERVVGQKVQPLAFHFAATPTLDAPNVDLEKDTRVPARQIPHPPRLAVVPTRLHSAATAAGRFFERRTRVMTRAFGSPKTPRTVGCGRKPENAYASSSRRRRLVGVAIQT